MKLVLKYMICCYNGKFQEAMPSVVSPLFDCCQFGLLVFETMRTYEEDEIFQLDEHLDRLWMSAEILEIRFLHKKNEIRKNIKETVQKNRLLQKDLRIKVSLCSDFYSIVTTPLQEMPEAFYERGIEVADAVFERNFANAKYANPAYKYFVARQPESCFETIFFNQNGFLREGNISNVFAVFKKTLVTPQKNVLQGITRTRIIEIAQKLGIDTQEREISRKELLSADEIFITNTTKEVVSVRKWDQWGNTNFLLAKQLKKHFRCG